MAAGDVSQGCVASGHRVVWASMQKCANPARTSAVLTTYVDATCEALHNAHALICAELLPQAIRFEQRWCVGISGVGLFPTFPTCSHDIRSWKSRGLCEPSRMPHASDFTLLLQTLAPREKARGVLHKPQEHERIRSIAMSTMLSQGLVSQR